MSLSKQYIRPLLIMWILIGIVFIIKSPVLTWLNPPTHIPAQYYVILDDTKFTEYGLVTHVSDGDTITMESGQEIRLLGMDTPELAHPEIYIKEECFGKDAKARLEQLVLNKYVLLLKDIKDTDKYDRSLRFVFLTDRNDPQQKMFVNAYMIGEGYARAYIFEREQRFKDLINMLQQTAIDQKRGLWGRCDREKFRW